MSTPSRLSVLSRVVAAFGGGYVLVSVLTVAASLVLAMMGVNKAEAVLATTIASFLIYALIIMAVFHARSATRAWIGILIATVPLAAFSLLIDGGPAWASLSLF